MRILQVSIESDLSRATSRAILAIRTEEQMPWFTAKMAIYAVKEGADMRLLKMNGVAAQLAAGSKDAAPLKRAAADCAAADGPQTTK